MIIYRVWNIIDQRDTAVFIPVNLPLEAKTIISVMLKCQAKDYHVFSSLFGLQWLDLNVSPYKWHAWYDEYGNDINHTDLSLMSKEILDLYSLDYI